MNKKQNTYPDAEIAIAIEALTSAALRDTSRGMPVDFAEIACHVITSVAANLGGADRLLAGRPGSWEADLIRQIIESTAGPDLAEYRTQTETPSKGRQK